MAHPTVKYFCVEDGVDYHMLRCWWYKKPRPADLEGSHPYYDDPNRFTARFFDPTGEQLDFIGLNRPKVILETWTAPDCIWEDKHWGQWSNYGNMVLENLIFIKGTYGDTDGWKYLDAEYRYDKITHLNTWEGETLYLDTSHIPREKWSLGTRPRPTPDDIKRFRGMDLLTIKPDVVVVNNESRQ